MSRARRLRAPVFRSRSEKIYDCVNYAVLAIVGFVMVFPFYVVLVQSVTPPVDFGTKSIILWPSAFDLSAYRTIIGSSSGIIQAYKITVSVTIIGTFMNMLCTILCAVGLSNKKLPYRRAVTLIMIISMYFGPGMIPSYIMIKNLGLINNYWVYILPGLVGVYITFLMRNFIMGIPGEILESAVIDGCTEMRLVWYIILPLSTACIATFVLFYAVGHWNDLMTAILYMPDQRKYTLQAYLLSILQDARNMTFNEEEMEKLLQAGRPPPPTQSLRAANIMAATIPIVCIYPFLQKYFVKGVVVGSLKG